MWKPEDGEGPSPWNPRRELVPGPETGKNRQGRLAERAQGGSSCGSSRAGQAAGTQAGYSGEHEGASRGGLGPWGPEHNEATEEVQVPT